MQESKAGVLVKVSVCLLTSHSIRNVILTFAPLGVVLKMYEDTKWHSVISNLKHFFRLIYRCYILISYVDNRDGTRRLMYIIKRLLNVYCEIFGTRSYGGEALANSCVLRHMNSCRIFHNIHSITYNYTIDLFANQAGKSPCNSYR